MGSLYRDHLKPAGTGRKKALKVFKLVTFLLKVVFPILWTSLLMTIFPYANVKNNFEFGIQDHGVW